ncbi:hypothetical protein [Pseudomonas viridiflava]|uniref:hypothetical protein n=1 Tax=Pseudomonas viridiflava TaxID=33069 RepID=UPI000F03DD75|nr:hypothetical protein [Pseudomonas viridiflava]
MKDRPHNEAMAYYFRKNPTYAAELLAEVRRGGGVDELAIVMRQIAAAGPEVSEILGSASERENTDMPCGSALENNH